MKLQFVIIVIALLFFTSKSFAQKKDKSEKSSAPIEQTDTTSDFNFGAAFDSLGNSFGSMFSGMGTMYKSMASQMMEGAIEFYEQPEMIKRIAALNKKYYDALKQAGFSDDQAMRILTSSPLSIGMMSGKQ